MGIGPRPFCLVLLVVVVNSPLGGFASVPAFALLRPPHSDCMGRRLADALPPLFTGGCFDTLLHGECFAAIVALVVDRFGQMCACKDIFFCN